MAIGHDNVCDYSVGDKVTLMIYLNHCGTGCDASCCTEYGRILTYVGLLSTNRLSKLMLETGDGSCQELPSV